MMRVLFFNIAYMYYYKGSHENIDTLCRHQSRRTWSYEFSSHLDDEWCLGFFETKRTNREMSNQLRIERLPGIKATGDYVDNVWSSGVRSLRGGALLLWVGTRTRQSITTTNQLIYNWNLVRRGLSFLMLRHERRIAFSCLFRSVTVLHGVYLKDEPFWLWTG